MPRTARQKSVNGFYHIVVRGIGRQNIFEDDSDRQRFVETLKRYKDELDFDIHAYCIMSNHVHMLLKDNHNHLDLILKKIAGSYAYYFNWKYDRTGHLFQDLFKSEPINDDSYYLTVLRYIHQNPYKAGIAETQQYQWSSYNAFIDKEKIVSTQFALDLLGGKAAFTEFHEENEETACLDISETKRITDEKAKDIIREKIGFQNPQDLENIDIENRNLLLLSLKEEGLSIRQISRLTGINRGMVMRA